MLKKRGWDDKVAYLYILPMVILSIAIVYYCIGFTIYVSFTNWDGMSPEMKFVGLLNYQKLLHDSTFYTAVVNNIIFFFGTVFIQAAVGLLLAVLLKQKLPGHNFFKAIYFMPIAMATSIITAIFRIILNPTVGDLNIFLRSAGLDFLAVSWLGDKKYALIAVIAVNIFQWMGFSMMTYYAALLALPEEVYESARLDGAGFWRTLFSITLPMLRQTSSVLIILGIVGSLKTFDIVKLLTNGGPGRSTAVLNTYLYEKALNNYDAGGAAAIGVSILIIALIMSALQVRLSKEK